MEVVVALDPDKNDGGEGAERCSLGEYLVPCCLPSALSLLSVLSNFAGFRNETSDLGTILDLVRRSLGPCDNETSPSPQVVSFEQYLEHDCKVLGQRNYVRTANTSGLNT